MRNLIISTALFALMTFTIIPTMVQAGKKVSPLNVGGAVTVDAKKAKALFDKGVVFVDVRKDKDYVAGRIPAAVHMELKRVYNKGNLGKYAKPEDHVVFYCDGGDCVRSARAAKQAVSWGYSRVHYFRNGFQAWKSAGYPIE